MIIIVDFCYKMCYIINMNNTTTKEAGMFKVKAVNSDMDFCECCGKTDLKKVVWVEDMETGETKHFGTVCAQSPEKGMDKREVKKAVTEFEAKDEYCRVNAFRKDDKEGFKARYDFYWDTYTN